MELRADAWNFITDMQTSLNMLKETRRLTNDIPLLLTCRNHLEGGFQKVASKTRDVSYMFYIKKSPLVAISLR
ncbi:type I 3-dehydroquinate dehydratase [Acetomicrobium sp.]|uniref:type I 3-dehydroquinate dehydratase n=1 Tax=Acetomicrobium sp. TaxID=1872099 RepID=UPI002FC6550B